MGDRGGSPGGRVGGAVPEVARRRAAARRAGRGGRVAPEVNPVARAGFGRGAESYDRARPGWPREALAAAFEHFGLEARGARVVDLAAGTGRLTRELVGLGADVVAVEPVAEMRDFIAGAETLDGTAEAIPLPDGSRDAVFVGEAFHWFEAERALPEMARVLRPGGGLALMWNAGLPPEDEQAWRADVVKLIADVHYHPQGRAVPSAAGNDPREDSEWQSGPGWERFEPLEYRALEHEQRLAPEDYVTLVSSWSFVAVLDDGPRNELLGRVGEVLERHRVSEVVQRWRTDAYLTRRRA